MRMRSTLLGGVATAAALVASVGSGGAKPVSVQVPACALGRLPADLRSVLPADIASEQRSFASSLAGATASERRRATKVFATGIAAYLYGMPVVTVRLTVQGFPRNLLVGIGQLATPNSRAVVAPNHDTLYSVSQVDLSGGPIVIDAPATGGRYSVLQLLDAYTNAFAYIGSGSERDHDETVVLASPGWRGQAPAHARVVHSPTKLIWLLGRTLVDGPDDLPAAKKVMQGYALTPLARWTAGEHVHELVLDSFPGKRRGIALPRGLNFYDALGAALAADPPPPRDGCALRAFGAADVGVGRTPSTEADPLARRALIAAAAAGKRVLDRATAANRRAGRARHNGWDVSAPDTGRFRTDYAYRAVVASNGLAANVRSQALYPSSTADSRGRPLTGNHDYVVSFPAGGLPPVHAFWSLTMYNQSAFLVANPIGRYNVGDRTKSLRYGAGRSLKIYVGHRAPPGRLRSNWLPAPAGRFELRLRLYEPAAAAVSGRWEPPTVSRTSW